MAHGCGVAVVQHEAIHGAGGVAAGAQVRFLGGQGAVSGVALPARRGVMGDPAVGLHHHGARLGLGVERGGHGHGRQPRHEAVHVGHPQGRIQGRLGELARVTLTGPGRPPPGHSLVLGVHPGLAHLGPTRGGLGRAVLSVPLEAGVALALVGALGVALGVGVALHPGAWVALVLLGSRAVLALGGAVLFRGQTILDGDPRIHLIANTLFTAPERKSQGKQKDQSPHRLVHPCCSMEKHTTGCEAMGGSCLPLQRRM